MNEATVGRELTAGFRRLMDHEPPFRTDLAEAIRAAEQAGRRRRNQTLAIRGGAAVLAIAASTALVIAWPGQPRALAPPAVVIPTDVTPTDVTPTPTQERLTPSGAPPSPTRTPAAPMVRTPTRTVATTIPGKGASGPTNTTPSAVPSGTMARLERLARQVAAPAGGVVTVKTRDAVEKNVVLSVETERGYVEVAARVSDGTLDAARQMCVAEGDLCTTEWSSESAGAWSRGYSDQPGRENLLFVTSYPHGPSLWLGISNWHQSGTKPLGPTWEDIGITVPLLRQAEADAGLNGSS